MLYVGMVMVDRSWGSEDSGLKAGRSMAYVILYRSEMCANKYRHFFKACRGEMGVATFFSRWQLTQPLLGVSESDIYANEDESLHKKV